MMMTMADRGGGFEFQLRFSCSIPHVNHSRRTVDLSAGCRENRKRVTSVSVVVVEVEFTPGELQIQGGGDGPTMRIAPDAQLTKSGDLGRPIVAIAFVIRP